MVFGAGGSDKVQGTGMFGGFKMYRKEDGGIAFGDEPEKEEAAKKAASQTVKK